MDDEVGSIEPREKFLAPRRLMLQGFIHVFFDQSLHLQALKPLRKGFRQTNRSQTRGKITTISYIPLVKVQLHRWIEPHVSISQNQTYSVRVNMDLGRPRLLLNAGTSPRSTEHRSGTSRGRWVCPRFAACKIQTFSKRKPESPSARSGERCFSQGLRSRQKPRSTAFEA